MNDQSTSYIQQSYKTEAARKRAITLLSKDGFTWFQSFDSSDEGRPYGLRAAQGVPEGFEDEQPLETPAETQPEEEVPATPAETMLSAYWHDPTVAGGSTLNQDRFRLDFAPGVLTTSSPFYRSLRKDRRVAIDGVEYHDSEFISVIILSCTGQDNPAPKEEPLKCERCGKRKATLHSEESRQSVCEKCARELQEGTPEAQADKQQAKQQRSREKVIGQVTKLLALAENNGATPSERETAWDRIHTLLADHALELADIQNGQAAQETQTITYRLVEMGKYWEMSVWKRILIDAAARLTFTKGYTLGNTHAQFVGRETDVEVACFLFQSMMNQLLASYALDSKAQTSKGMDGMTWKKNYLVAAALRVEQRAESIVLQHSDETALVVISETTITDYMAANFKVHHKKLNLKAAQSSAEALEKGMAAGDNVRFDRGVEAGSAPDLLPEG